MDVGECCIDDVGVGVRMAGWFAGSRREDRAEQVGGSKVEP